MQEMVLILKYQYMREYHFLDVYLVTVIDVLFMYRGHPCYRMDAMAK